MLVEECFYESEGRIFLGNIGFIFDMIGFKFQIISGFFFVGDFVFEMNEL